MKTTRIPDPIDRGHYEGHDLHLGDMHIIWSVGDTPRQAIAALGRTRRWGKVANFSVLRGGNEAFTWGFRFTVDGTSMKAAGIKVSGGYICTWWK